MPEQSTALRSKAAARRIRRSCSEAGCSFLALRSSCWQKRWRSGRRSRFLPRKLHVSTLAGQPAVFHCTIRAIRVREKYCADDTFAREVFHLDSFSSLEKALRDQLQSYIDRKADEELKNDLLDQVCANARLSATSEQIARAVDREMKSLEGQLARQSSRLRRTRSLPEKPLSSCARITCRTRRRICSASR